MLTVSGEVLDVILSVLIAFGISAALGPVMIPMLHKLKFGQQIREEGPEAHKAKSGTPTMGGIMFLIAISIAVVVIWAKNMILGSETLSWKMFPILLITLGFGLVGFLDDFLKVVKKQPEGLKPWQKMGLQFVFSGLFIWYMMAASGCGSKVLIPVVGMEVDFWWFYIPFAMFVLIGTDNGVNFCDGLDGLCSSVTAAVAVYFTLIALLKDPGVAPLSAAVFGALLGFLLFNVHPAKVFMGDTGSLSLGAYVGAMALYLKQPIYLILVGFIYMAEVLSVIIQVTYFKKTGGKRIFRMAPIHHHFELGGWSETRVVAVFTIVTILLCLVAYCI